MIVSTNNQEYTYDSIQEVIVHVQKSASVGMDDIWISKEELYPCLNIMVNGQFAVVHYFEDEDGDVWQSLNEENDKEMIFMSDNEEWEPPADVVISIEDAILCIQEFLETCKRPVCIEWQEL